ncbi:hypothetical protein QAD02_022504 [Eretmocerus hayati]|uniref:Uncharacterized protein n=1 Tax=Eretmocerus hayati TaxID=131215 RepID=A0ACC2PSZ1_9HYME|nr:hypothetical protein QAD02_022504 [Eretmocerus hayati]
MPRCSVNLCGNRDDVAGCEGISYFRVPKKPKESEDVINQWIKFFDRDITKIKDAARICSAHFEPKFLFQQPKEYYDVPKVVLLKGAVPTLKPNNQSKKRVRLKRKALADVTLDVNVPLIKRSSPEQSSVMRNR